MRSRFSNVWESLRESYWFVPTLLCLLAIVLSVVMVTLDARLDLEEAWGFGWITFNQPDGARALLSTVAGSMMTVAGVTFSVTMVVLSLTSQQFGPRLLRNFMRDTGNQLVLGTFVATFIYCLLVLRTVRGGDEEVFVPHLSVALAALLALVSVAVLIYFIHHTAEAIQISNILDRIGRTLDSTILRIYPGTEPYPEMIGRGPADGPPDDALPEGFERQAAPVRAVASGYFQTVDEAGLLHLARERQVLLRLTLQPGDFVPRGSELVRVWPSERADPEFARALRGRFRLGAHRTQRQDVDFLFDQFVEVALRALSPGYNDHYTALQCIDRIWDGLALLSLRDLPSPFRHDDEGTLRIVADPVDLPGLVRSTLGPIRRHGSDSLLVCEQLLRAVGALLDLTNDPETRDALLEQARLVMREGGRTFDEDDRRLLERAYRQVEPGSS